MSDEIKSERYSELAADGSAGLRQASFELDDNGGVLTLVQLERATTPMRLLGAYSVL